ncbi:MAG: hypothetical protein P1U40_08045 [Coxiellaceae bacterium]|nr:hypothetical protein [Coxiellaceae bacterium]
MPNNFQAAAVTTFAIAVADTYIGWEVACPGKYEWIKLPLLVCSLAVMKKMASEYANNLQQLPGNQRRRQPICDTLHKNSFTSGQMLGAIVLVCLSVVSFVSTQRGTGEDDQQDLSSGHSNAIKLGVVLLASAAVSALAIVLVNTIERRHQVDHPLAVGLLSPSVASSVTTGSPMPSPQPDDVVVDVGVSQPQPM